MLHAYSDNFARLAEIPTNEDIKITVEEKETIIIGLALRVPDRVIINELDAARKARNHDKKFVLANLFYYKKQYKELIDDIYVELATRVGEVFRFSDKLHRIGKLNDLAEALHEQVVSDFRGNREDDPVFKKANFYLKVLTRLDSEMGSKPLTGMFKRTPSDEDYIGHHDDDLPLTREEIIQTVHEAIEGRFEKQLPSIIREKVEFSNYLDCANGEKMGDYVVVCWNEKMTNGEVGIQCPVQKGDIKLCPKFLDRKNLDNEEWLTRVKERHLTLKDIAYALGTSEYDVDIRDRIAFFLRKYNIYRKPKEESTSQDAIIDEPSEDSEESSESSGEGDRAEGS